MLENEGLFKVLVLVHPTLIEDPRVKQYISLGIGLPKCFILTFFEIEELVLHIDALLILNDDDFIIGIMALILEPTKLLDIYFFIGKALVMHLQSMQSQLFSILKGNELLSEAIFVIADIM